MTVGGLVVDGANVELGLNVSVGKEVLVLPLVRSMVLPLVLPLVHQWVRVPSSDSSWQTSSPSYCSVVVVAEGYSYSPSSSSTSTGFSL